MKVKTIRSSWWEGYGYRLDCQPYLQGALETKVILEQLSVPKDPLRTLTAGHDGGIYNGPQFVRHYVDSPEYGVPFLGSGSMLQADLSGLPLLSRRDAYSSHLSYLEVKPGMTLISCSGTIGRTVFARRQMEGMWSSQHIMKVVADTAKILPGYLYAFLSSRFGISLVASGTYGSIIQSIEPEHIADIPVPRFDPKLEGKIHDLVEEAAELRTKASEMFQDVLAEFEDAAGLPSSTDLRAKPSRHFVTVSASELHDRMDTNYHRAYHYDATRPFISKAVPWKSVGEMAVSVIEPIRFKRVEHDDEKYSIPFFGTGALGDIDPQPLYRISAFLAIDDYRVTEETVLIPRSGQICGIIGTAFQPIGLVLNAAVTEDAIRINCRDREDAGYIFLALRSEVGIRQLKSRAFGGSIPHLDVKNVGSVRIADLQRAEVARFGREACKIAAMRTRAIEKELQAKRLVGEAIEAAGAA